MSRRVEVRMPPLRVNQVAMPVSSRTRAVIPPNRPVGVLMLVAMVEVMTTLPIPRRARSPLPAPTPIRQPTGTRTSSAMLHLRFRRPVVSLLSSVSPGRLTMSCAW